MTETQVYWWLMLDKIGLFWCFPLALTVATFFIIGLILSEEDWNLCKKFWKFVTVPLAVVAFVFGLICFFIPTSKQYAMIKIFPKIANSELSKEVQQDVPEMYTMAKDYMKEMLKVDESAKD
ncbi:hypothetical protein HQ584_01145 [Patescibacteria group bacterium]|nr:hypothetical protein [Patescibacteria group bacterium]